MSLELENNIVEVKPLLLSAMVHLPESKMLQTKVILFYFLLIKYFSKLIIAISIGKTIGKNKEVSFFNIFSYCITLLNKVFLPQLLNHIIFTQYFY